MNPPPLASGQNEPYPTITLCNLKNSSGVFRQSGCNWKPCLDGILSRHRLHLPDFTRACYYAPFQKYAINPALDLWPEGYNQCHPLPITDFRNVKRGGMFTILQLPDGNFLTLLPLTSSRLMSWMRGDERGLVLESGHWGTGGYSGDAPLLAWGQDANPYRASELAWRAAASEPEMAGNFHLRSDKPYPEIFEYLGWCSWEEFKLEITDTLLVRTIDELNAGAVPVRWVLVDDGHLDTREVSATTNTQEGLAPIEGGRLRSFGVNTARFPSAWTPLFDRAAGTRIRWLGVWLNFNGYWGGIDTDNTLDASIRTQLLEVAPGQLMPRDNPSAAAAFYSALLRTQHDAGFSFIKVDNQAKNVTFYRDKVPNAVAAASGNHHALEEAMAAHLEGMINCMAHNNISSMHTACSQVTRCSEDYKKGDLWRAKHHLNNSYHNILWLGQTVWGDHDMFHSSDTATAALFARSKAISGGPIYLSDRPDHIDTAQVKSLCFEDGRLLRPLAPAVPTPESLFVNTYEDDAAYRVIAPLPNRCAVLVAYNLTHPEKPVRGTIQGRDYSFAPGMSQSDRPEWPLPSEGVLCYEPLTGMARPLHLEDHVPIALPVFGDALYLLAPITHGWAVLGRPDKILSPCAVEEIQTEPHQLRLRLLEQGPLLIWSREGHPHLETVGPMQSLGHGLWKAELPVKPHPVALVVTR